jgi:hypothetical protein
VRVPEAGDHEPVRRDAQRVGLGTRPRFLTAGALRLAVLCALVVAIGMLSPRLTPDEAGRVVLAGVAVVVGAAVLFVLATHRTAERLRRYDVFRPTEVVLIVVRRVGLPLLGLAFFLVWTFVYLAIWAYHPTGAEHAFDGLDAEPRFADFFYYAVSTAFISPPGDIVAASRGTRSATLIEMLTGLALVTAYAGSFVDWHARRTSDDRIPRPRAE